MKLSIIIPVYNEEKTIRKVINKVKKTKLNGIKKEIIVVNDGSNDNTQSEIQKLEMNDFKVVEHKKNLGKGMAIKTGLQQATGDYILIQDADLEYNPEDIERLMRPIQFKRASIVYGTRLKRLPNLFKEESNSRFLLHYFGNRFLSLLVSLLYGQKWLTDIETGYKVIPKKAFIENLIESRGFEMEVEITARLLKKGYKICEIPIKTIPRTPKEGKKLKTFRDGFKALYTLLKYKFVD